MNEEKLEDILRNSIVNFQKPRLTGNSVFNKIKSYENENIVPELQRNSTLFL